MENQPEVQVTVTPPADQPGAPAVVVVEATADQLAAARTEGQQTAELSQLRETVGSLESQLRTLTDSLTSETARRELAESSLALALVEQEPEPEPEAATVTEVEVLPEQNADAGALSVPRKERGRLARLFLGSHPDR